MNNNMQTQPDALGIFRSQSRWLKTYRNLLGIASIAASLAACSDVAGPPAQTAIKGTGQVQVPDTTRKAFDDDEGDKEPQKGSKPPRLKRDDLY